MIEKTIFFLDTPSRQKITSQLPICSVPVLGKGTFINKEEVLSFLGPSLYKTSNCVEKLKQCTEKLGLDYNQILKETDNSPLMEGLYIKVESNGQVMKRLKYVRASFNQGIQENEIAWLERPIIPNELNHPLDESSFR